MKIKFPLLIVLMLAFSIGNAQSNESNKMIESSKTISVLIETEINTVKENDSLLIDNSKLKTSISRSSSDIRVYLNRKRNAGNISFVFPKINKAVRA